jgi:hypothetical protein
MLDFDWPRTVEEISDEFLGNKSGILDVLILFEREKEGA